MKRLYIVVREDLPVGLAGAQLAHAALILAKEWQVAVDVWHALPSANLILLGAQDEAHLLEIFAKVQATPIEGGRATPSSLFREEDLQGAATAFACIGGQEIKRALRHLPKYDSERCIAAAE